MPLGKGFVIVNGKVPIRWLRKIYIKCCFYRPKLTYIQVLIHTLLTYELNRAVASGGTGGALAPLVFGQTVNPISTRGADYTHHSTTSPPPEFQTLRRACNGWCRNIYKTGTYNRKLRVGMKSNLQYQITLEGQTKLNYLCDLVYTAQHCEIEEVTLKSFLLPFVMLLWRYYPFIFKATTPKE